MSDRMLLIGSEDVRSASHTISAAAREMKEAASSLDSTFERFSHRLDNLETILTGLVERLEALNGGPQ